MEVIMKKQFLALIALGSLVNAQAMFEYGGYVVETQPALTAIENAANAGVQAIKKSGQVAVNIVNEAGIQVLTQIRSEAEKFAAAIPQPVIKESIVEQIQRLGFKQYATKVLEQAKSLKVDLVPLAGCMIAGALVEPAVTAVYNKVYNTVWTTPTIENIMPRERILIQEANPRNVVIDLHRIQSAIIAAGQNTAPIANQLNKLRVILHNELRNVCLKLNTVDANIAQNQINELERDIMRIDVANTTLTNGLNAAHATNDQKAAAERTYTATANNVIADCLVTAQAVKALADNYVARTENGAALLFPTPVQTETRSLLFPFSETTKACIRKATVGAMVYGGYVFVTTK